MTTLSQQHPPELPKTARKVIVEVVGARDLLPKDGQGSSSPYVIAEFDGQKKRTSTKYRDLNPVWNEALEFTVSDPDNMESEELEIEVFNDKKFGNGSGRKNHFLGRFKLYGSQFAIRGEEVLAYFPLEKKSVFSWIRGEIGLRVYYYDEIVEDQPPPEEPSPKQQQQQQQQPPQSEEPSHSSGIVVAEEGRDFEVPTLHMELPHGVNGYGHVPVPCYPLPPVVVVEESPPDVHEELPPPAEPMATPPHMPSGIPVYEVHFTGSEVRRTQRSGGDRVRILKRPNGDYSPREIGCKNAQGNNVTAAGADGSERIHPYDLLEPMQYLFVKIVKARKLAPNGCPYVKIRTSNHYLKSKPMIYRPGEPTDSPEWSEVFALGYNKQESANATLEISVWDSPMEHFLGGVCFDLSDVPVRESPDGPLAPQWHRLENGSVYQNSGNVSGDILLSVWIGTQNDDAFPKVRSSDAPYVAHTRSKVYQSPKLWYLRLTVIEAQDLHIAPNLPPLTVPDIRVKVQLGFQCVRSRRGNMNNASMSVHWNEELIFVAGEPLEESLTLLVEDCTNRNAILLGHVTIPLISIQQRIDDRHVASKWLRLEGGAGGGRGGPNRGGIHLWVCLEGGYHVLDEAAHVCSDFRPTAKQLWKPAIGILELGIPGARGLLPMKDKGGGKGSTDAYCVAKYGKKWVRTRTVTDSFNPRWNEQYTWQVYDPCTVLTIGVFDDWRMIADVSEDKPDSHIGKIRIRISTLEANKVYTNSYPLLVLTTMGLKKMGEIELAIRFACSSLLPETCSAYRQPLLPRMHYLRPIGVTQQEALRGAATKMVAQWLASSEPPLGQEVVRFMLDADCHKWSMRKCKANWFRVVAVLGWAVGLAKWMADIRWWKKPVTTMLVHVLYLVLVWYPDLIVPTGFLYVVLIGIWYRRFRPQIPSGMDIKLSQAETVDADELDEEFDTIPSSKPYETIRARYGRLRILAARVQTVLGNFATQCERLQALVTWKDPRATKLFIGVCLTFSLILYVVPTKMVAVALGFYYLRHPMFRHPMPSATLNFFLAASELIRSDNVNLRKRRIDVIISKFF